MLKRTLYNVNFEAVMEKKKISSGHKAYYRIRFIYSLFFSEREREREREREKVVIYVYLYHLLARER